MSQLDLYLLERKPETTDVDEVYAVVVASYPGHENARGVAARKVKQGDQSPDVWRDSSTIVTLIATNAVAVKPCVVHESFQPG